MRDFHLRFALSTIADLGLGRDGSGWFDNDDYAMPNLAADPDDLDALLNPVPPDEPGAYVLGTADGTMLVYPWGLSPVYYIGMTDQSLQKRLATHAKDTQSAVADHAAKSWYPRIQYGAAFGAHAVWYLAGDMEPKNIEAALAECFCDRYGSIPVGNGDWPQYLEVPTTGEAE